jgi:hypothetical protein
MVKKGMAIVLFMVTLYFPASILAETIVLKSGKTIEGKILERTDKFIYVEQGKSIENYPLAQVESIDGKSLVAGENSIDNPAPPKRNLPFSTAVITYKDTSSVYNGEETAYIDAVNNKVALDTSMEGKLGCATKKINKRKICDGKTMYDVDYDESFAPSFAVRSGDSISNIFNEELFAKYYKGNKSFLGKECKVYSSMPGEEFYFWNGIVLKQKVSNSPMGKIGNISREAVNIKLNIPISDDKFEVPFGMKVLSEKETMDKMKDMIEGLKKVTPEQWKKMQEDIKKVSGK